LAFDRDATLKRGEKFLRQGRLDAAIGEYLLAVQDQPRDWNTANLLGDLYVRAGQSDKALEQYNRIADHLMREGFLPKAAALYKKVLKVRPDDEGTQLVLADISAQQKLLADAKNYLNAVGARRRARGDRDGVADIAIRLGSLDPDDFEARLTAARTLEEIGQTEQAATRFRTVHDDLDAKGLTSEALDALRDAVRLNPQDQPGRRILAKAAINSGDVQAARPYLDRETAADDQVLLAALVEIDLRSGELEAGRALAAELLQKDREIRHRLLDSAWALCTEAPEAAWVCIDAVTDAATAAGDFAEAAVHLQELVARKPGYIPALLKLVEVCVDGGLESTMYETQVQLTDAYLENGHAAEACVIAEDLVAREPWERAHIERFRRALVMLKTPDPDTHIAERLSGQAPFMATDHFVDLSTDEPAAPAVRETARTEPAPARETGIQPEPRPAPTAVAAPRPAAGAPSRRTAAASVSGGEIDLTGALGSLEGFTGESHADSSEEENLGQVFDGMRAEAEKDQDADFAAQYVKLAQTYVEMNMLDEAISSLKTAVRSPRSRFEAASLLGRLYMRRGDAQQAIEWLERAAQVPAPTVQDGRALLYDLGVMLEGAGEVARALAVLLELQADAGDYRDVPARIDRLARVQTGG
jgi:tetratricopeptide (TPR) repeat protein